MRNAKHSIARVSLVCPVDQHSTESIDPLSSRFADLYQAFEHEGLKVDLVGYHDAHCERVFAQLQQSDAVLVWFNPIQDGCDRSLLNSMLERLIEHNVYVSAHPQTIAKLGTKSVLYKTRKLGWGCDTHQYESVEQLQRQLAANLSTGKARVLKSNIGSSGDGVWKVQWPTTAVGEQLQETAFLKIRSAKRGSVEQSISFESLIQDMTTQMKSHGPIIDQAYQERLPEGMVRCYLVHDKVAGFGHQAINALHPAPDGAPPSDAPEPGPRLYHPPTLPAYQHLKNNLEAQWLPQLNELLGLNKHDLPVIWDCDFLLGPKSEKGDDTYVLCEINTSSVAPYPPSAIPYIVQATFSQINGNKHLR